MVSWVVQHKTIPYKINIAIEDLNGTDIYVAEVYYKSKPEEEIVLEEFPTKFNEYASIDEKERNLKRISNQYPAIEEHIVTDEMDPLTECERNYTNHLKGVHSEN
jgi:hypothetical protein